MSCGCNKGVCCSRGVSVWAMELPRRGLGIRVGLLGFPLWGSGLLLGAGEVQRHSRSSALIDGTSQSAELLMLHFPFSSTSSMQENFLLLPSLVQMFQPGVHHPQHPQQRAPDLHLWPTWNVPQEKTKTVYQENLQREPFPWVSLLFRVSV